MSRLPSATRRPPHSITTHRLGLTGIVILSGLYRWSFHRSFCITAVCTALAEFPARLKWESERSLFQHITVKNRFCSQFLNNVQKDLVRFTEVNVTLLFSMRDRVFGIVISQGLDVSGFEFLQ